MSYFLLSKNLIPSIEEAMQGSWWGNVNGEKKMAWVSWPNLCKSKKLRGLGFRDIRVFSYALLAKQCWRIFSNPESFLSCIFRARYFPSRSFLNASLGNRPSATGRSLLPARSY